MEEQKNRLEERKKRVTERIAKLKKSGDRPVMLANLKERLGKINDKLANL